MTCLYSFILPRILKSSSGQKIIEQKPTVTQWQTPTITNFNWTSKLCSLRKRFHFGNNRNFNSSMARTTSIAQCWKPTNSPRLLHDMHIYHVIIIQSHDWATTRFQTLIINSILCDASPTQKTLTGDEREKSKNRIYNKTTSWLV